MKIGKNKDGFTDVELEPGDVPDEVMTHAWPAGQRRRSPNGKLEIEISATAVEALGRQGRLISASKTSYRDAHPEHEVYFNGCLFDPEGLEIWFGDIDLTLERGKLEELAGRIGTIYLTPEHPYRFDGFQAEDAADDERVIRFPGPDARQQ